MYRPLILNELQSAKELLDRFIIDSKNIQTIERAAKLMANTFKSGKKALLCGNGGSSCDAMHFAGELTGRYRNNRIGYPAISISDPGYLSCVGNDFGYSRVFSRYVESVGSEGDVLVGISTSGNSENILLAIEMAKKKRIRSILLTGNDGGKLSNMADVEIKVPHFGFPDRIQEIHIKIIHILTLIIEEESKISNPAEMAESLEI